MPETMLAAVLPSAGAPLQLERIPIPQPRRGEVLVRVAACGVCHTDLHVIKGEVAFPTPAVLGHEISGTVAEVGEGVDHLRVGDAGRRHLRDAVRALSRLRRRHATTSAGRSSR